MPNFRSLKQLSTELAAKTISSTEITQHYLARIHKLNPQLNCFISVNSELALEAAAAADQRIAQGNHTPLTGIPIAHKDIFCTKGIKTSCASKMLDNFIAPYDASMVKQLQQHGMVMLGKLNMDEFAMGSGNEHSYYGACHNPWDLSASPGGSSGGSAAAVAAGLTPAASGTDTGGSIRQPAAFCGVTGLKPTYGRISRYGMIAFASSLDQAGPITHNAEDAAMLLEAMAGHDPKDSTSAQQPVPAYSQELTTPLTGLRIGIPQEYFRDDLDPAIASTMQACMDSFKQLGCQLKPISLPHTDLGVAAYYIIAPAECSANLARYDGVRYGYRCKDPVDLEDLYKRSRSEAFGEEVQLRILLGTYVLSSGFYDAYYRQAQQVRRLVQNDFLQAFGEVDLILAPTTPNVAHDLGAAQDQISTYMQDMFTIPTNLAGLPGISIPAGFNQQQRPIGAQLIAPHFAEARLLQAAHQFQQHTDWHQRQAPICEELL